LKKKDWDTAQKKWVVVGGGEDPEGRAGAITNNFQAHAKR